MVEENTALITVKNLKKEFKVEDDTLRVLKGINLKINLGEFVVILGPSGSGKSTLLNIMIGLEDVSEGEIFFCGVPIHSSTEDELAEFRKQHLGIVYQQPIWVKSLNVLSNVAFPLTLRGIPKQEAFTQALNVMEKMGMSAWMNHSPVELSSGQQQKISLARALVTDPSVIIADEPTGNLDYSSGKQLVTNLQDLTKQGKTVVMITHDLENVKYATKILRFFDGNIIEEIETKDKDIDKLREEIISKKFYEEPQKAFHTDLKATQPVELTKKKEKISILRKMKNLTLNTFKTIRKIISPKLYITLVSGIFSVLLLMFTTLMYRILYRVLSFRLLPHFIKKYKFTVSNQHAKFDKFLSSHRKNKISYYELLLISLSNIVTKKTRSIVTIGGVGIGIGFTVLLISIGFGLEKLVISRIAKLDQLTSFNVVSNSSANIRINNSKLEEFKQISNVEEILPLIAIAGKSRFQDSSTDIVVEGAQNQYLNKSDASLIAGEYFSRDSLYEEINPVLSAETNLEATDINASELEGVNVEKVYLTQNTIREAVVNRAYLNLINLNENSAVGSNIELSFIATEEVLNEDREIQSYFTNYQIVGVIDNYDTPLIFVPLEDIKSMSINNYSEARIITSSQADMLDIRQSIEIQGFKTNSIVDTIEQVESVFATVRSGFAIVGMVALAIASFGMFNTLTISLLERTREVGLMKAIGMKSGEVKDLFLTESISMGLLGGIFGIIFGLLVGFLISAAFSVVAISRGEEFINLTYLPVTTMFQIILVAIAIGVITGFYPALRATRISPINALRYE